MHRRSNLTLKHRSPRPRALRQVACTVASIVIGWSPHNLAVAEESEQRNLEVTALVGYRGGGDFDELEGPANPNIDPGTSYGVALGWLTTEQTRYELLYDVQRTSIQDLGVDLDVEHLHIGGTATFGDGDGAEPYIAGGLGATRLQPSTGDDETRFSISIGFGIEVPVNERLGVRLEARGYLVSMSGDSQIFCASGASGGTCLVRAAGDTMFQYALLGGIGLKF
jgi:opacity protein-like surface antigen